MVTIIPATKGLLEFLSSPKETTEFEGSTIAELVAASGRTKSALQKELRELIAEGKVETSRNNRQPNSFGVPTVRFEYRLVLDNKKNP